MMPNHEVLDECPARKERVALKRLYNSEGAPIIESDLDLDFDIMSDFINSERSNDDIIVKPEYVEHR